MQGTPLNYSMYSQRSCGCVCIYIYIYIVSVFIAFYSTLNQNKPKTRIHNIFSRVEHLFYRVVPHMLRHMYVCECVHVFVRILENNKIKFRFIVDAKKFRHKFSEGRNLLVVKIVCAQTYLVSNRNNKNERY